MNNPTKIEDLPNPVDSRKTVSKSHVDDKFNDRSIIRNSVFVDFTDENFYHVRFLTVNSLSAVREHLTQKLKGNTNIGEPTVVRNI